MIEQEADGEHLFTCVCGKQHPCLEEKQDRNVLIGHISCSCGAVWELCQYEFDDDTEEAQYIYRRIMNS